jgi:GNAT superfamily N-acetyltransferase
MNMELDDGFTIKMATDEDSRKIIAMLKQVALWMKEHDINQWGFLLDGGDDEEIEQAISNQETYMVLRDHEIVATFTLLSKQSEWDQHIWGDSLNSNSLYLHRLAVIPIYMKKGLGRRILSWIQNNVRDVDFLKLDCVADNRKLNTFYTNNRFEFVGVTDGHRKYQKCITKNKNILND